MLYVALDDAKHMVEKATMFGDNASDSIQKQLDTMSISDRRLVAAKDNMPILPLRIRWAGLILVYILLSLLTVQALARFEVGNQTESQSEIGSRSGSALEGKFVQAP